MPRLIGELVVHPVATFDVEGALSERVVFEEGLRGEPVEDAAQHGESRAVRVQRLTYA